MRFSLRLALFLGCAIATSYANEDKNITGEEKPQSGDTQYWQAILGDICQLPGFPRATGDPQRYVECVKQNFDSGDRKDLGIWLLRECLPGYEFVASARRCKTTRSIRRQQQLCEGPNASSYQFCPNSDDNEFMIREIRQAPRQCTCPNGENNCVCPTPEILEPVLISRKSKRSPQYQSYNDCNCQQQVQQQQPCACQQQQQQQPQLLSATQSYYQQPSSTQDCGCAQQTATQSPSCSCQTQYQPTQSTQAPSINNCQTTTTQQQYCPQQTSTIIQPQPCPLVQGGTQNARYQGICSWMVDPLATDPESQTHFLQCQPAPNNLFCGRWQRMPCAPGTVFDVNAQVCVWNSNNSQPGTIPPYVETQPQQNAQCGCTGGVQIGSCNANYQCPGQSVCQVGQQQSGNPCMVCCYYHKKH